MAKRRTVSRQWSTVNRLNQRTRRMRSRIYNIIEDKDSFTFERDIGDLPWSWDDFGYQSPIQYLHSTVRGFNQDYKQLTQQLNLESHIQSTIGYLTQLITKESDILRQVAERDKIRFFGAQSANTPLKSTPYVQSLLVGVDPDRTNNTQVQVVLQEMKNASNWYTWEGNVLSQLKQQYDNGNHSQASQTKFYSDVVDYIWESWQNFISLPLETIITSDDAEEIINKIKSKKITKQKIANWIHHKTPSKSTPFGFSRELGLIYEDAIRESIVDYSIRTATNMIVERIGQKGGLVDVALYNDNKASTNIEIDDLDRFTGGISAKLRYNNHFSIEVAGSPQEFFQFAGAGFESAIQAIRFLYNNWMALSVYNSETDRAYSNAQNKTRTRKGAILMNGGHLLGRSFQSFARVANLILIHSAFFANAKDIGPGNTCLFNQEYWDRLITQLDQGNMTIPAFIFTTNDYYETWQIVNYYLQNPLLSTTDLFGSSNFLGTQNVYNSGMLKKLYAAKAKAIKDTKRLHSDLSLYDAIHLNISDPLSRAYIDCFQQVLNTNRKLSVEFRLIASNQLH